MTGALSYNGQRCTAIKIIFVHRSVADAFVEQFADAVSSRVVVRPWEEGVQITPLPEAGKPQCLRERVDEALTGGARIVNAGGGTMDHTLVYPEVLYPCRPEMPICQVEQFGPVVPIPPFEDESEVIRWVLDSPHGQQAALFGTEPESLCRLIDPLVNQFCRLNINSQCQRGPDAFPFTGRKDSAENTLSVSDALRVFSIRSLVAAKTTDLNEELISRIVSGRHSKFLRTGFFF